MTKKAGKIVSLYEAGRPSPYHQNPPYSRSADSEYSVTGRTLRDWARHLADNSSVVSAILSTRVTNGIGPGLTYEPLVKDRKGELIPEINAAIRRIHARWSEAPDVTGELSRPELERLVWRTWDQDGEAFIRRVVRKDGYRLQVIPTDWIPGHYVDTGDGKTIIHGVEKDEWGKPTAYYIEPNTYDIYEAGLMAQRDKMTRIGAEDIWHLKRVKYPNQTRGVTLLHAIIFRIADIAEFQQSHRLAARASADLFASINRAPETDLTDAESREWTFDRLQVLDELLPGESVNFHRPAHPNQNAVDFVREELRAIAAGSDVGFSQIAQVFDSSYAAQRLEIVDTWRKTERARSQFISDFAKPALYMRVVEHAAMTRQLPAAAMRRADPLTLFDVRIDGPTMPVIDPVKDRKAFELDQTNRWDSRHGIMRRMGRVPADVDAEIEQDEVPTGEPIPDQSEG